MKTVKIIAVGVVTIFSLCFATLINNSEESKSQKNSVSGDGFAVLELFTSEGCSSCPPADELLARIQQEAGNAPVYVLAYHVDYWNRLGWKDQFSKPEFSKRQYQYSSLLNAQVYTPQLIINGKAEFVGSDAPAIKSAIRNALRSEASAVLTLGAKQIGNKLDVIYNVEGNARANRLMLAIVQKYAVSNVTGGENSGHTLSHVQIVRDIYNVDMAEGKMGGKQITVPTGFNAKDWEVIGMLQDESGAILGAAKAQF